eukprot:30182_5
MFSSPLLWKAKSPSTTLTASRPSSLLKLPMAQSLPRLTTCSSRRVLSSSLTSSSTLAVSLSHISNGSRICPMSASVVPVKLKSRPRKKSSTSLRTSLAASPLRRRELSHGEPMRRSLSAPDLRTPLRLAPTSIALHRRRNATTVPLPTSSPRRLPPTTRCLASSLKHAEFPYLFFSFVGMLYSPASANLCVAPSSHSLASVSSPFYGMLLFSQSPHTIMYNHLV